MERHYEIPMAGVNDEVCYCIVTVDDDYVTCKLVEPPDLVYGDIEPIQLSSGEDGFCELRDCLSEIFSPHLVDMWLTRIMVLLTDHFPKSERFLISMPVQYSHTLTA